LRFTELFETLQERPISARRRPAAGCESGTGQHFGVATKQEILALEAVQLNFDPAEPPVLGRAADDRGGVRARKFHCARKDGSAAVFLESSRAVWDDAGKLIRYQGTLVDVTERRKLERQVAQQEEFRRRLLESFPDLILVVDLEERYTFVSSRVQDLLGCPCEDLLGKKVSETQAVLRNWSRCTMTWLPARKRFNRRNTERGAAMESGKPCGPPPANFLTRITTCRSDHFRARYHTGKEV